MLHSFLNTSFGGTLILSVLVLSSILVILFYPKQYLDIQLGTKDDKLKLKDSAIEGFVRCVVDDYELIKKSNYPCKCQKK